MLKRNKYSIKEIAKDEEIYKLTKSDYIEAFESYKKNRNNLEFIKFEKIKLEKLIEDKVIEINYLSNPITFLCLACTIITTCLVTIFNNISSNILLVSTMMVYSILSIAAIICYDKIKDKYKKHIANLQICLKVLEDFEEEKQNKLDEVMRNLDEAIVNSNNIFNLANKSLEGANKKLEKIIGIPNTNKWKVK